MYIGCLELLGLVVNINKHLLGNSENLIVRLHGNVASLYDCIEYFMKIPNSMRMMVVHDTIDI